MIVFFGLVVLGFAEGFFEFAYAFPEAFAYLRKPVGTKEKKADQEDNEKLWKSYTEHVHLTFSESEYLVLRALSIERPFNDFVRCNTAQAAKGYPSRQRS